MDRKKVVAVFLLCVLVLDVVQLPAEAARAKGKGRGRGKAARRLGAGAKTAPAKEAQAKPEALAGEGEKLPEVEPKEAAVDDEKINNAKKECYKHCGTEECNMEGRAQGFCMMKCYTECGFLAIQGKFEQKKNLTAN